MPKKSNLKTMLSKSYFYTFLFGILFVSLFFLIPAISHAAGSNVPLRGNYTISSSCTFEKTVDGIDDGDLIVDSGATLTVNAGHTVVWPPGHSLVINGAIAIANGAQLKQAYLWVQDSDNDGYPDKNADFIAQTTQPSGRKRLKDFTSFTYKSNIKYDYDDSNGSVYPGTACNGDCSYNDDNGDCVAKAAGENGLPACQRCDGTNLTHVNVSGFADSEGTNTCAGTCAGYCSSGSCVSTDTGTGTCNTSDSTRVASAGNGHCSAGSCAADCYANGTSCSNGSDCCSGYCYADGDGDGYAGSGNNTCRASASLGTDCNDSNASLYVNRTCYADSDGDGYYAKAGSTVCSGSSCPSGYSSSKGNDCCDSDNKAHPNQTSYFSSADACGSYDYNCDGSITKQNCTYKSPSLSGTRKTCFRSSSDCNANTGSSQSTYPKCSNVTHSMNCGQTATSKTCRTTSYKYCRTSCSSATRYPSYISGGSTVTCSCR